MNLFAKFRFNPVALKELRQLVRERTITTGLLLYPLLLFVVTLFVLAKDLRDTAPTAGTAGTGSGEVVFAACATVLGLFVSLGIPYFAASKTVREIGKDHLNLIATTRLSPTRIVDGKFLSVFLLMVVMTALTMPFLTLAYLLRGVPLGQIFGIPPLLIFCGLVLFAQLLLVACQKRPPALRMSAMLILIGLNLSYSPALAFNHHSFRHVYETFAFVFTGGLALIFFCRAATATVLSPPYVDRLRLLRVTEAVLAALTLPIACLGRDAVGVWCIVWFVCGCLVCLLSSFSYKPVPRIVSSTAPKNRFLRLLRLPFTTGNLAGQTFGTCLVALALAPLLWHSTDPDFNKFISPFLAVFAEVVCPALILGGLVRELSGQKRLFLITGFLYLGFIMLVNLVPALDDAFRVSGHRVVSYRIFGNIYGLCESSDHNVPLLLVLIGLALATLLFSLFRACKRAPRTR